MHRRRRAADPLPDFRLDIVFPDTTPPHTGHNACEADTVQVRAAMHGLVEGLSADEVHAVWQVVQAFLLPARERTLGLLCLVCCCC